MKRVLVADDSPTLRRMVVASLSSLPGVTFAEAATGLEAIERLSLEPVDAIVLDLNMPDVHGMEVLRFVRAHQAFSRIPVLILTTRGDEESRSAALEAGANAYCTKPFKPAVLSQQVRALLGLE